MKYLKYVLPGLLLGLQATSMAADLPLQQVRIKNFREILFSYESILNVDSRDPDITATFRAVKDRLPSHGLVEEFGSPAVMAMTELSGLFCAKAINKEKDLAFGERILFSDVDFARGPNQFSSFLRLRLTNHLAGLFWGRSPTSDEIALMDRVMMSYISGTNVDVAAPAGTINSLQMICTTYATSLAFLVK